MRYAIGLAALSVALAIMFVAARWIQENYVPRSEPDRPAGPFDNPGFRRTAEVAARQFSRLPAAEQAAIRENLEKNTVSVARWLDQIRESRIGVICLGEDHEDATRRFLAQTFFREIAVDALLLEVTPHQLGQITQELRWGRERVALLGADIAGIIRAVRDRNPEVELVGIEETKSQRIARQSHDSGDARDASILNNFFSNFQYGRRYVILFGALHCTDRGEWLYGRIDRLVPRRVAEEMTNVRIVEERQEGSVEALKYFLEEIGIRRDDFAVVDSKAMHPRVLEWFEILGVLLDDFDALVVFRDRP